MTEKIFLFVVWAIVASGVLLVVDMLTRRDVAHDVCEICGKSYAPPGVDMVMVTNPNGGSSLAPSFRDEQWSVIVRRSNGKVLSVPSPAAVWATAEVGKSAVVTTRSGCLGLFPVNTIASVK